ncbi:hypothetical protein [Sporanaerobacter acetigenes]|uniref:Uncharacterized protein n=1 Tax=Sporanaerobacter acetigenes DSM 13106 TaxID=1123281 RepID=A0A1M5WVW0_9FIRM|nr:hypothetical protein [Sporanaerobacter acetigenes]SHH91620.1 hypothetical protein SAMN02745180_01437 [Sporanaerobacter acetigenes DSM 13106]
MITFHIVASGNIAKDFKKVSEKKLTKVLEYAILIKQLKRTMTIEQRETILEFN